MTRRTVRELLYEALETELGGVQVYETALRCVRGGELHSELRKYHEQTMRHVQLVREALDAYGLDPEEETPGRQVVRHIGRALVEAMEMALSEGAGGEAELVALECITLAETKDHLNWELVGELLKDEGFDDIGDALREAYEEVEEQEDEHLYHSQGWAREMWLKALGVSAVIPPPEEQQDVTSEAEAAQVREARKSA
jgi:bacterioferritin (cytochrome b1)